MGCHAPPGRGHILPCDSSRGIEVPVDRPASEVFFFPYCLLFRDFRIALAVISPGQARCAAENFQLQSVSRWGLGVGVPFTPRIIYVCRILSNGLGRAGHDGTICEQ